MNVVATWLYLIGTPERARKLRARVDGLASPSPIDPLFGPEPPQCPTTVLFGAEVSRLCYINGAAFRAALDAWDTGAVSRADLRRWCLEIEKGKYTGPTFYPDAAWRDGLRILTTLVLTAGIRTAPYTSTSSLNTA
jgi:hypothetical protein